MATLPTFTVTDATAKRLMDAFEGEYDFPSAPGEEPRALTPVQAYKRWLKQSLVAHVRFKEQQKAAQTDGLDSELPL